MLKKAAVLAMSIGIVGQLSAHRRDSLVRFDGGIGVIPASSAAGPVNTDGTFPNVTRNVVRGVNPPGQPWRIADLKADIDVYGRITVKGRGLLLAGGNGIGTNANQKVFATLICEAASPFTEHSTDRTGVALAPDGDFRIDDTLNPPVPSDCASPVLLIRNTGGTWFVAAIANSGDDDYR